MLLLILFALGVWVFLGVVAELCQPRRGWNYDDYPYNPEDFD